MASSEQRQARQARAIQESIRDILLRHWDPIGINDVPEAQDEYDSYVGGVYRLLASHASADEIIDHLFTIESQTMGLSSAGREKLRAVANRFACSERFALNMTLTLVLPTPYNNSLDRSGGRVFRITLGAAKGS